MVPGPEGKVGPEFEGLLAERFGAELGGALTRPHRAHGRMQLRENSLLAKTIATRVEAAERRLAGFC